MRIVLFVLGLLFVAAAQSFLSEPFIFQPDTGELGWPAGATITALSAPLLWWASRPGGGRLWHPELLAGLAGLSWIAAAWIVYSVATDPWTLHTIPQWLNPSTQEYRPSPGTWLPFHVLNAAGPVFAVLALGATEQPRRWRWRWAALGGAPWLLGVAAYAALMAQTPPVFLG